MTSKIHAASEEGPSDGEQSSRALRISVVSRRALSLPSAYLGMWERSFLASGKFWRYQGAGRRECTGDGGHADRYR